ncbi:uncharacterized protein [Watersipora subatra]|uniref:uncharacterized protein n=1 Tax=Watersipora subatra TaxID=2589382 RepID=UPI00355C26AE
MPAPVIIHQQLMPVDISTPFYTPVTIHHLQPLPAFNTLSQVQPATSNYNMVLNYSMELVWHGEFNRLFQSFLPTRWQLKPTFALPKGNKWTMFKDSAKVRFLCQECLHGWTSMKGRVVFWFTFDKQRNVGTVLFRLFGQRCQACSPKHFEHAMWYPEEVVKVVGNVFNRIGQEYYGFYSPPVRIDRRAGKPRSQHNSTLCQACSEGICPGEFDASVETYGLYRKTYSIPSPSMSSYPSSLSSQCSTDAGSIDELSATPSDIISDESHSDTTSEASLEALTNNISVISVDDHKGSDIESDEDSRNV